MSSHFALEAFGRRVNLLQPDESLLLKKPLLQVAHGGGKRLRQGTAAYHVLRDWIAEGMKIGRQNASQLQKIEAWPKKRVFDPAGTSQQLTIRGTFSDGTVRDLTSLTDFSSSDEAVGTVSDGGLVEKIGRGETTILARYLDKIATCEITFLNDVKGFSWPNPPEENFIDRHVYDKLKQLQIPPSPICSDEVFLRRTYLDLTGRLPSIKETTSFLSSKEKEKRNQLIDRLLDSSEFASFWTLKWADVLRSNRKKLNVEGVFKFHRWIAGSINRDQPLDQFAKDLLTASGSVSANPAANYWRASRDPQDATETTAQLFLGIRMQCAKCHNHPFERWTQDHYYGVAAAFSRIDRKKGLLPNDEIIFVKSSGEMKQTPNRTDDESASSYQR